MAHNFSRWIGCYYSPLGRAMVSAPSSPLWPYYARWCFAWFLAALLGTSAWWPVRASDSLPALPRQVQHSLELEDWPAVLNGLAGNPLTNSQVRLAVTRALFETGRLPEEQFSWFHSLGPDLFSTSDLKEHAGLGQIAETLLQVGHLNAAERTAFDSLELEGETPSVLRTLARVHIVRDLPQAAAIFLNRLQTYPGHSAWVDHFRAGLVSNSPVPADPALSRIRTNLVTRDRIAAGLTTDRLLKQALEANPENRLAFQLLMAHQLMGRQLLNLRQTLSTSPQTGSGPLPRHYAEAVLLHRQLYPGISVAPLLARVPAGVAEDFQKFQELMSRASNSPGGIQLQAWRDFGSSYWYYHYFSQAHPPSAPPPSGNP